MTQACDYFFVLAALAVLLVLWLIVRALKGGQKKVPETQKDTKTPRRIERVGSRAAIRKEPKVEPQAPRPERVTGFYFKTEEGTPFAWVRLSSIGAQAWGYNAIDLSEKLNRFIERFLKPEDNESLLISVFCTLPAKTPLIVECFTEKGERIGNDQALGLTVEDFPKYSPATKLHFDRCLLAALKGKYHDAFYRCQASDQAYLIRCENRPFTLSGKTHDYSKNLLAALSYLMLLKIAGETNFYQRARLWNFYWSIIETKTFPYTETLNTFERVVISQTFVQTQKLPFLLIQTPKGWGKCYNALNY